MASASRWSFIFGPGGEVLHVIRQVIGAGQGLAADIDLAAGHSQGKIKLPCKAIWPSTSDDSFFRLSLATSVKSLGN